ncbi:MAG: carbohydrate ABC transporter permease [Beutenbergiaceae bacterium]
MRRRSPMMWLFILPAVVPYLLFVLLPAAQGLGLSFTDWNLADPSPEFTGIDNYVRLLGDATAVRALTNTLFYVAATVVIENLVGLGLALGIKNKLKSRAVLRVVFFAPVIILSVVIGFLWRFILLPDGPVNQLLTGVGLENLAQPWFGDPSTALWAIVVITAWQFAGYTMVIYLANLEEVPGEQLEAAALDGAGPIRTFVSVIRPLLTPSITINVVLSTIRGLMIFDIIWVTTQGGPANLTHSLATLVYQNAFQFNRFGYGLAIAVTLSIFVAIAAVVQFRLLNRRPRGEP